MNNDKSINNIKNYNCNLCDYTTCIKCNFDKHFLTDKHKNNELTSLNNDKNIITPCPQPKKYSCQFCEKTFNDRAGVWRHKQKCTKKIIHENENKANNEEFKFTPQMFYDLLKQNSEFKELLVEQNKYNNELINQVIELSKEKTITNNNTNCNNKKFNLNFFLNETCKDALNLTDFVSQLSLGIQDLIDVGELGFAEGVSKSFIKGLKELDVCKRPLHCTDKKRETIYVKDENKWQKEDDKKDKLTKASKQVGYKNVKTLPLWKAEHPNFLDPEHEDSEQFSQIIIEAMTCGSDEKTIK